MRGRRQRSLCSHRVVSKFLDIEELGRRLDCEDDRYFGGIENCKWEKEKFVSISIEITVRYKSLILTAWDLVQMKIRNGILKYYVLECH